MTDGDWLSVGPNHHHRALLNSLVSHICQIKGKTVLDFWDPAKKMLADTAFLQSLLDFDRDHISPEVAQQVSPYLQNPDFEEERVRKASVAAAGLCKWVRAIMLYHHVSLDVVPKRKRLAQAKRESEAANQKFAETSEALRAVMAKLERIEAKYKTVVSEKESLQGQISDSTNRLARATKLIGSLGGERTRWAQRSKELAEALKCIVGDVAVCAAVCTYLGPFEQAYRSDAMLEVTKSGLHAPLLCPPSQTTPKPQMLCTVAQGDQIVEGWPALLAHERVLPRIRPGRPHKNRRMEAPWPAKRRLLDRFSGDHVSRDELATLH